MQVSGRNPNRIYITWNFTSMCNFSCSYCPENLHDGKYGFPDIEDAIYFLEKMCNGKQPDMFFEILGGETTMWPKMIKFLKECVRVNPNIIMEINTNGSRTHAWWERFVATGLQKNVVLNFSYHAAFCDPDLFYNNLKIASESGYAVSANYMLDPEYFYKILDLYKKTHGSLKVDTSMKVLRPDFNSSKLIDGYTEEMLDYISNTNENELKKGNANDSGWNMDIYYDKKNVNFQKQIIEGKHSFQFWQCSAGSKRIFIEMNGDVWVCSELIGYNKYSLGNIFNRTFESLNDYITCPAEYCACKVDALAYKYD